MRKVGITFTLPVCTIPKIKVLSFDYVCTDTQEVNAGSWNYFYVPGTYYSKNQSLSFDYKNSNNAMPARGGIDSKHHVTSL